ncbi:MAG: cell division protein ZapA [Bacteroidetes bacterium]|jgi:cell division protein ZapA (FtsZ GTPase activity inhibitor)|nr:MAG: cell division protein ZapA [Bacteroidota bacterium]TAE72157.1 MAG: cell division protein ZapA [Bacteroidota bacterium]TAF92814.1 MAG: cell division protein ZapA [Bacteroidota bacterium]
MSQLLPVNLVIGDRTYRVKVEAEHEEHVRKFVKRLNDKIIEFKTQFAGKDMQDYVAMALIWSITEISQADAVSYTTLTNNLQQLTQQIAQALPQNT